MILEKKRVHFLLFVAGVIALSITAEKCRELVGKEAASKSGEFTFLNCFDANSGTLACLVKEGVKLYSYSIRSFHVEGARNKAIEASLADALTQGLDPKSAANLAQKEGAKAAKLATRKVKRIVGPIISSGWDFFEALYFGGTMTEGFLRGTGTLFGTYAVGYVGEDRFGRFGYLLGSHLGSWIGGRIGLMFYDVVSGVHFLLQSGQSTLGISEAPKDSRVSETPGYTSYESVSEAQEDSFVSETPTLTSFENSYEAAEESSYMNSEGNSEAPEDLSALETPADMSSGAAEDSSYMNGDSNSEAPEDLSALETPTDMSSEASEETIVYDEPFYHDSSESFEEL